MINLLNDSRSQKRLSSTHVNSVGGAQAVIGKAVLAHQADKVAIWANWPFGQTGTGPLRGMTRPTGPSILPLTSSSGQAW